MSMCSCVECVPNRPDYPEVACEVCGEPIYEPGATYCEDCRDSGDLEDVLERALDAALKPKRKQKGKKP